MKRFDFRTLLGAGLVLLGGLMLVEKALFEFARISFHASDWFWGLILLVLAGYFLQMFSRNPRGQWWAVIPGLTLAGMALDSFLPELFSGMGGAIFLGAIAVSFWVVYLTDHSRWWAIIPGGVLFTLATISLLAENDFGDMTTAGVFFVGLGLTFLLVAVLPNPFGKMQWAYIPAAVLVIMGALFGSSATQGLTAYIWPIALILIGAVVLIGFFVKRD